MYSRQTTTLPQSTEINSIYEILYHGIELISRTNLKGALLLWKKIYIRISTNMFLRKYARKTIWSMCQY